jgi:hypothetical protein
LVEHPELQRFDDVGLPMHLALHKLEFSWDEYKKADQGEHIVIISETQPGITSVITETRDGRRIANLYEVPIDALTMMLQVTPEPMRLYVAQTLQMSLQYPEYLTEESYWLLSEMVAHPEMNPQRKERLLSLHTVLGLCLEYGLGQEWIAAVWDSQGVVKNGNSSDQ